MKVARRRLLGGIAAAAAAAMIMMPGTAFAKGGPPGGGGHGGGAGHGGGGGGESTVPNNLSVPTIMVGSGIVGVNCPEGAPDPLVTPSGTPLTGYPIDPAAYYYVQGVNTWQAQCYTAASASVTAAWGSNLTGGEAKLSVGKPIRVELGLFNANTAAQSMDGYTVDKLDPNALDRESAYGTLATGNPTDGFSATSTTFTATQQRVYASGATFSICLTGTTTCPVPAETLATAEINATGNVVYGYNLRVSTPGSYTITFTMPASVTFAGGGNTASIDITVTTGGGGGGGHG